MWRRDYLSSTRLKDKIAARVQISGGGSGPRASLGVSCVPAADIRALRLPDDLDQQVFVVIDTALPGERAHASAHAVLPDMPASKLRQLRTEILLPLLENHRMTVDEAYVDS